MKANAAQERRNQKFRELQRQRESERKRRKKMARPDNFYDMVLTIDGSRMLMNPWDRPQFRSQEEELKFRLAEANQKLAEQDTFLKGITEGALVLGTVLSVEPDGKRGIVSAGPQKVACNLPKGAKAGDTVRVVPKTSQPLDVVAAPVDAGEVCTVAKVHGDLIEISSGMGTRTVARGSVECEPGTRIVVDSSFSIALRSLGSSEDNYLFAQETSVSWEDIGGLEAAKEAIREAIEFPITHADLYRHYGKQPSRGVLLYGPPGCGKTMLGKAAATALQKAHGGAGNGGFIYVKGPEVLSKWVGEAEATVRGLFAQARAYKAKTGHSAVLFIDEAEALLASRNQDGYRGGIQATLVPAFLAEMDGLEDSGAFVILSTNRPDSLDSAITRDGRIDRKVQVTRPDKAQALRIFELAVRGRPSAADDLAKRLCDAVFTSTEPVVSASAVGITVSLNLADCMSGALVAGIVNRATEEAMRRDRESGVAVPSGINDSDVRKAVSSAALEMRHLDWRDELVMKAQQVAGRELIGAAAKAHAEMN